jgi:DtxR family Mn-dependent transcriptional regulator
VRLTVEGRKTALKMLRRHRIIETYLIEELDYAWDDVHDEAERLEHAVSDRLIEAMAGALEDPRYDPHGAPIPTADGEVEVLDLIPMTAVPVGSVGEVRMVSDKDPERLRFLASLGLKPGVRFTVLERQPFNGPVTLRIASEHGGSEVVGYELAHSLQCVEAGGDR